MKKIFSTSAAVACLLVSCGDSKMTNSYAEEDKAEEDSAEAFIGDTIHLFDEDVPPVAADMLFSDFFFNFIDDPKFQAQRVVMPLPIRDGDEVSYLNKEQWKSMNHFRENDYYYVIFEREEDLELQKDTSLTHVAIEWYNLAESEVDKCNFDRSHGRWMLHDIVRKRIQDTPNANFLDFYTRFVTDSVFQRESITQPIKLVLIPDDGESEPEERYVDADEWMEMKEDFPLESKMLVNMNYGQTCISQNRKTLMLEGISNGMLTTFRFAKDGEQWRLTEIEY